LKLGRNIKIKDYESLLRLFGVFSSLMRVQGNLGRILATTSLDIAPKFFLKPSSPLPISSLDSGVAF